MIYTHMAAGIAGAVLAGLLSWNVQAWRYDAQLSRLHAQHATALASANQKALDDTIKMQRTKDEAIKAAEQRAKTQAANAANARADADRLRAQLDGVPARVARATDSAVRDFANVASDVLGACIREYQGVAAEAEQHASNVRLLIEAWPK